MKKILLCLIFFLSFKAQAVSDGSEFFGKWLYYKMVYKGELIDPLNPQLVMIFTFQENGINNLSFHKNDEEGFCERTAVWMYDDAKKELHQQVTWANPANRADCSNDPDFQVGHESFSPFKLDQGQLYLSVPLSDETVQLVWKKLVSVSDHRHF